MTDHRIIYAVVISLASIALAAIIGSLVLSGIGRPVPGEVVAMGSGAGGALASILARTSARREGEGQ